MIGLLKDVPTFKTFLMDDSSFQGEDIAYTSGIILSLCHFMLQIFQISHYLKKRMIKFLSNLISTFLVYFIIVLVHIIVIPSLTTIIIGKEAFKSTCNLIISSFRQYKKYYEQIFQILNALLLKYNLVKMLRISNSIVQMLYHILYRSS